MRNLLMALGVVGLLAAPSLGVVNVKVTADGQIIASKVQLARKRCPMPWGFTLSAAAVASH
jgi:hypothetical protein